VSLLPCEVVVLMASQAFPVALIRWPGFSSMVCVYMARTVFPSTRRSYGVPKEYPTWN
jgi:hypothetical protein